MSQTEYHKGTLVEMDLGDIEIEEYFKGLLQTKGIYTLDKYYDSYTEQYMDNFGYYEYLRVDDKLYKIYDTNFEDGLEFEMSEKSEGVYEYYGSFYNGGTCLHEMLEESLTNILNKNEIRSKSKF